MNRESENVVQSSKVPISVEYYIEFLLRVLKYARIWPAESFSRFQTLLSMGATIIFISTNFLLLFSEIIAVMITNDLRLFANIIGVIGMHSAGLIKWCYCIRKNKEIIDIVMQLEKCHVFCQRIDKSDEGYRIYKNKIEYAHKYSNFFLWCWTFICIYGVLHWCANPLLLEWISGQINLTNSTFKQRILPFIGWYPLNTNNIHNYVCLYLMQIIGGISPALGIIYYDTLYITLLMVLCAQFQYINIILTKSKINFDKNILKSYSTSTADLERKLKTCVDSHTEIIKFLKVLQIFSGPTMFVQCIETLIILCLTSFEASVIKIAVDMESILKLWSLFEYFLCAAIELYIFCSFATQVQYLGLQLAHSVYFCGWENFMNFKKNAQMDFNEQLKHRNINRLMQMIMVQAQKSIVLTGGPFYVLSLETFRVIMSMAMSTSVMLRTVSES